MDYFSSESSEGRDYRKGRHYRGERGYQEGRHYRDGRSYQEGSYDRDGRGYQEGRYDRDGRGYQEGRYDRDGRGYQRGCDNHEGRNYRDGRDRRDGPDHREGRDYRDKRDCQGDQKGRSYRDKRDKDESSYQASKADQWDRRYPENKRTKLAEPVPKSISLSSLMATTLTNNIQGTAMVMKTLPLNPEKSDRTLNSEELSQGIVNKTLGSPLLRDIIKSIRIFCEKNTDPEDFVNYNGKCALENIRKLVKRGRFRYISDFDANQAIECILQFRNAHSHNDFTFLLKYNRMCLSAIATMSGPDMIDDPIIFKDVMEKLKLDGGKCSLPEHIPVCQKLDPNE